MGRRIFKKVYNGEILEKHLSFVYDGYKLIEERNTLDNNEAVRKYVWQPEALDRVVPLTVYDAASEKTYYYHTDANKNVTELSDEAGNVVAHYEYSPFGSLTKVTGDYAGSNPFRFSSEYFDEETGLVYYNYRYYGPELGRWISRDPIEEQGGYNLYGMIKNNPLLGWDELGYDPVPALDSVSANPTVAIGVGGKTAPSFTGFAKTCFHDGTSRMLTALKDAIPWVVYAEHRKGKRKRTRDKHTKPRPGRKNEKKRNHPGWKQR